MYPEERRQRIVELVQSRGRVEVSSLSDDLDVTTETIRRDLTVLERHGVLRRVHGGAIPVERLGFEPALSTRMGSHTDEKRRIAMAALAEVPEEGSILLDAGSTMACLAEVLPADRELVVLTNGLPIAQTLAGRPNLTVMLLGGRVRPRTLATVDGWVHDALAHTFVDVAFIAANGVSTTRGLTTPDLAEAAAKRAMVRSARRTVLLADSSKFGTDHLAHFADLDEVDVVITDTGATCDDLEEFRQYGPRIVTT